MRWERIDKAIAETSLGDPFDRPRPGGKRDATLANACAAYLDDANGSIDARLKTRAAARWRRALANWRRPRQTTPEALLFGIAQALGMNEDERGRDTVPDRAVDGGVVRAESARRLAWCRTAPTTPTCTSGRRARRWRFAAISARGWPRSGGWMRRNAAIRVGSYPLRRTSELTGDAAGAKIAVLRKRRAEGRITGFRRRQAQLYFSGTAHGNRFGGTGREAGYRPRSGLSSGSCLRWTARLAQREWDEALSRYSDEQRRIAVEVADNGWSDRGVFFRLVNVGGALSGVKPGSYRLRFPLHH